ncbi:hypothetical protein B6U82_00190 [Candidatus Pacearchaeota archaeon ex4484_31]|nr:MAG: hypothetical protein B6U82_00190 [Candidatus Pacearchaeota archaeon ex4484_31]
MKIGFVEKVCMAFTLKSRQKILELAYKANFKEIGGYKKGSLRIWILKRNKETIIVSNYRRLFLYDGKKILSKNKSNLEEFCKELSKEIKEDKTGHFYKLAEKEFQVVKAFSLIKYLKSV